MTPRISVITRTLGRDSLRRAMESVERQGIEGIEIVVAAARPGIAPIASDRCPVRWLATDEPLHRCASANKGLEAARGDYLIFLDDDDWFEEGHLRKLVSALEADPEAVAAYTGVRAVSEGGELLREYADAFEPWQLMAAPRIPIHAALFRRSAVEAGHCRFDLQFDVYEDWDFWLQLRKVGRFVHVPGTSAAYLHAPTGSGVQSIAYGAEPYRKLWRKWGRLYSEEWLASIFEQANQIPGLRSQCEMLQSALTSLRERERELVWELVARNQSEQLLISQINQVTHNLNAVLTSTSWKLTAWPRRLVEWLRARRRRYFPGEPGTGAPQDIHADAYLSWIAKNDTTTPERRQAISREIAGWPEHPLVSVVMPVYNAPIRYLREAIDSVLDQCYPDWELCIADDASTLAGVREALEDYARRDKRIRVVYRKENGHIVAASNSALAISGGTWVALLDQDDLLPPHALFEVVKAARSHPEAGVIYSDEDKMTESGERFSPYFKPDYNYELLLGQNMLSHLGAYRRSLLEEIGGFQPGMEGSQDHDLALRCIEKLAPAQVVHIPKVLYHWRVTQGSTSGSVDEKPYALTAGLRAVNEHLARTCPGATAERNPEAPNYYRVRFPVPSPAPSVSIIIPTRNAYDLVSVCLNTLFRHTRYRNYEVIVVDNGSDEPALLEYLASLARAEKIKVLRDDSPFNFASLNNHAVARSKGEFILLLNNDIEVIEDDWLDEMVSIAARPGVGAVGARLWYPGRTLQHGGVIVGLGGAAGHAHHGLRPGNPGYFGRAVLLQALSAVTGACLLVRRRIYDEVGGLDEKNLAVAFNDIDFCLKVMRAGYRNVWTPHAQLVHHESATRGSDLAPEKAARFQAEIRFMQRKWGREIVNDPAYNINLSLNDHNFTLGDAPRDQFEPTPIDARREEYPGNRTRYKPMWSEAVDGFRGALGSERG